MTHRQASPKSVQYSLAFCMGLRSVDLRKGLGLGWPEDDHD